METVSQGFTIFPAIDLRSGRVVRLVQGDPARQTVYSASPAEMAWRWIVAGARWLHVVNLDAALGETGAGGWPYAENLSAIGEILAVARQAFPAVRVQLGGGLRTFRDVEQALALGASRVILGTAAAEDPALMRRLVLAFGPQRIGLALDVRAGQVRTRGWLGKTNLSAKSLADGCRDLGLTTAIYTNITRDGGGQGVDVQAAGELARLTGLDVIASGGAGSLEDVRQARSAGLSGLILGRALYDGRIDLREALQCQPAV